MRMEKQISFEVNEWNGKKKQTKREKFLARMEQMVPWKRLVGLIEPHYPNGRRGRPPIGIERMLRVYFLQQWYGLADEALEDAIYDSQAISIWNELKLKSAIYGQSFRSIRSKLGFDAAICGQISGYYGVGCGSINGRICRLERLVAWSTITVAMPYIPSVEF